MEEGKGERYLAPGRQYGNALLGVCHQEEEEDTSTGGGRWRRQHKTELDGDKWSVFHWQRQGISQVSHSHCSSPTPVQFLRGAVICYKMPTH